MGAMVVALALLVAAVAEAAEWGAIRAGESTQSAVRTQLGQATKVASTKVEGYDTVQWVYEGAQAPRGMTRVTIDFGLLTPQGYRPDVVRQMILQPKPGVFTRKTILDGWGQPDVASVEDDKKVAGYRSGLFVYFDKAGEVVERMYFTPPQPLGQGAAPPRR
jgi:hypothetical protein